MNINNPFTFENVVIWAFALMLVTLIFGRA